MPPLNVSSTEDKLFVAVKQPTFVAALQGNVKSGLA